MVAAVAVVGVARPARRCARRSLRRQLRVPGDRPSPSSRRSPANPGRRRARARAQVVGQRDGPSAAGGASSSRSARRSADRPLDAIAHAAQAIDDTGAERVRRLLAMAATPPTACSAASGPARRRARARGRAERLAEEYPDAESARSTTTTRSSCWRPRSCRRSPPTRGSTWSRRRCSPATRRRPTSPPPTRPTSRRSSTRPASTGNKTKSLIGMASARRRALRRRGADRRSRTSSRCPGVGRKTGNVVRSVALRPARPARRHPRRAAVPPARAHDQDGPGEGRAGAEQLPAAAERGDFSLRMILHGRRVCFARSPVCGVRRSTTSARRAGSCRGDAAGPSTLTTRRRGAASGRALTRRRWYDRCYQPGSRHLVCSDSRDPPPGVARATAPPTRGRRRFSAQIARLTSGQAGQLDRPAAARARRCAAPARPRRSRPRGRHVRCRGGGRRGRPTRRW